MLFSSKREYKIFRFYVAFFLMILLMVSRLSFVYAQEEILVIEVPDGFSEMPVELASEEGGDVPEQTVEEATPTSSQYTKPFIISAYYSPLPNQKKYVTGSYAGDIRLNGNGVHSADGTAVYPGMIAAPKTYAFGTKMRIPGLGVGTVHDRGGAIVSAGRRGHAYDRLDIWMGYGDQGLTRALIWGKRTVDVTVYGVDPSIPDAFTLAGYSESEKTPVPIVPDSLNGPVEETSSSSTAATLEADALAVASHASAVVLADESSSTATSSQQATEEIVATETLTANLTLGSNGTDVLQLQEELQRLGLFGIQPTGYYGELTSHAVFKFQQIHGLVGDTTSLGAGIFGPITRQKMNAIVGARLEMQRRKENLL